MGAKTKTKARSDTVAPTLRQAKLADALIHNAKTGADKTRAELARQVGYSVDYVRSKPSQIFSAEGLKVALAQRGVTVDKVSEAFDAGLDAKVVTTFQGEATQTKVVDLAERRQWLSLLGDFLGMKKQVIEQKSVNVSLGPDELEQMLG